jgi:hypothetical protein
VSPSLETAPAACYRLRMTTHFFGNFPRIPEEEAEDTLEMELTPDQRLALLRAQEIDASASSAAAASALEATQAIAVTTAELRAIEAQVASTAELPALQMPAQAPVAESPAPETQTPSAPAAQLHAVEVPAVAAASSPALEAQPPAVEAPAPATAVAERPIVEEPAKRWFTGSRLAIAAGVAGVSVLAGVSTYLTGDRAPASPPVVATSAPTPPAPEPVPAPEPTPASAEPQQSTAPAVQTAPPMRFRNPFDRSEVFEFPAGTTRVEARAAVAEILLERARERRIPQRPARKPPAPKSDAAHSLTADGS